MKLNYSNISAILASGVDCIVYLLKDVGCNKQYVFEE